MASHTMGQLCCGQAYGKRWNKAWERGFDFVFGSVIDVTVDKFPQDLFDQLMAMAFWTGPK